MKCPRKLKNNRGHFISISLSIYSSTSKFSPNCEADSFTLLTIGEFSVNGLASLFDAVNFTSTFRWLFFSVFTKLENSWL